MRKRSNTYFRSKYILEVIKIKTIKNFPRFSKYTKDEQNHQKWVWTHLALNKSEQHHSKPFPSPLSAGDRQKDWVPHRNSASTSTSCPTIHRSLFLSSGIKGHLLEALATPGLGSLTASSPHIQFAFQDFLHGAPTIRIPKPSRGESLNVFLPWGTGGDQ